MDFINNKNSDFWNELTEAQQVEIKKGIEQLNKGSGDFLRRCLDGGVYFPTCRVQVQKTY
jgi:hypothetical protein